MADKHIPQFVVLGYSEAAMFLKQESTPPIEAAICIHGQRDPVLECVCDHRIDLDFDDCAMAVEGDLLAAYRTRTMQRKAAEIGLKLLPPRQSDVEAMIAFGEKTTCSEGLVLFQCHAGISRSSAAALIALAIWLGEAEEATALKVLREVRPAANPPLDLIRVADGLLQRDGKLLAALTNGSP